MTATAWNRRSALAVGVLLALPVCLAAQEESESRPAHARHYKVIDLGDPPAGPSARRAQLAIPA